MCTEMFTVHRHALSGQAGHVTANNSFNRSQAMPLPLMGPFMTKTDLLYCRPPSTPAPAKSKVLCFVAAIDWNTATHCFSWCLHCGTTKLCPLSKTSRVSFGPWAYKALDKCDCLKLIMWWPHTHFQCIRSLHPGVMKHICLEYSELHKHGKYATLHNASLIFVSSVVQINIKTLARGQN